MHSSGVVDLETMSFRSLMLSWARFCNCHGAIAFFDGHQEDIESMVNVLQVRSLYRLRNFANDPRAMPMKKSILRSLSFPIYTT